MAVPTRSTPVLLGDFNAPMGPRGRLPTVAPITHYDWWEEERLLAGPFNVGEQNIVGNMIQDEILGPLEMHGAVTTDSLGGPTFFRGQS
eukprot:7266906-Pyramimonas_sp.AAC.1